MKAVFGKATDRADTSTARKVYAVMGVACRIQRMSPVMKGQGVAQPYAGGEYRPNTEKVPGPP